MEDTFLILLGSAMLYSMVHFAIIQHSKNWTERKPYEKAVTIFALISIGLVMLGVMVGE